jgi:hypothetical protein
MRMYEESWITLKKSRSEPQRIKIAAHTKLHPRIFKAICKEKDMDTVFKFTLSENCQRAKLVKKSEGHTLIVTLVKSLGLDDL